MGTKYMHWGPLDQINIVNKKLFLMFYREK